MKRIPHTHTEGWGCKMHAAFLFSTQNNRITHKDRAELTSSIRSCHIQHVLMTCLQELVLCVPSREMDQKCAVYRSSFNVLLCLAHSSYLFLHSLIFNKPGPGGSGAFPRNAGCEMGIHNGWGNHSLAGHYAPTHTHTHLPMSNLELPFYLLGGGRKPEDLEIHRNSTHTMCNLSSGSVRQQHYTLCHWL